MIRVRAERRSAAVASQAAGVDVTKSTVSVSAASVAYGGTPVTITLQAKDTGGSNITHGGLTVSFGKGSGTSDGTISSVTDVGDGTYTATWTPSTAGTARSLTASIGGVGVTTTMPTITTTPGAIDRTVSTVTVASASVANGGTDTATLHGKDGAGNALAAGGSTVVFSNSGGTSTGTWGATTDVGNGTYTGVFTATGAGTATTLSATIGGSAVTTTMPTFTVTVAGASAVFTADLEGNSFGADQNGYGWNAGTYYSSPAAVSTDTAHSGTHSVKVPYYPGWAQVDFHLGAYLTETWYEFWLLVPSNFAMTNSPGVNNKFFLVWRDVYSLNPTSDGGMGTVGFEYEGRANGSAYLRGYSTIYTQDSGVVWDFTNATRPDKNSAVMNQWADFINNGANPVNGFTGPITPGTWAKIRVHMKTSSTQTALDGALQLSVNGVLFFSCTAASLFGHDATVGGQMHHGYLLGYPDSQFGSGTNFYIDDFAIYESNPAWSEF